MPEDGSTFSPSSAPQGDIARIVKCAQAGNEEAFRMLYEMYGPLIQRYLRNLIGDDDVAEELMAFTFFNAFKSLPTTNNELQSKIKPWLYKIATNQAHDYFRHRKRIKMISLEELDEDYKVGNPKIAGNLSLEGFDEEICEKEHVRECIKQALMQISPQFRKCFFMKDFEDRSHHDIAQTLGITVSCVRAYAARGRAQFRKVYKRLESNSDSVKERGVRA